MICYPWRGRSGVRQCKHWHSSIRAMAGKRWVPILICLIGLASIFHRRLERPRISESQDAEHDLWSTAPSLGWQASCVQQSSSWSPPGESSGYLVVLCDGGLNQQRRSICNAVLAARLMNATLVLPQLDSENGFPGIYDVDHFVTSLKNDVRVVRSLPAVWAKGNKEMKLVAFQLSPPRDAPVSWYETTALEKMKEHGAVYLTPFSHGLDEELGNQEYQRLRCRVNYHALRFTNDIRILSNQIVERLRSEGPYVAIHLGFEMDMLAFAGCLDIFNPTEQEVLKKYRKENVADHEKELDESGHRRLIGECPVTPREVGLFLHALGLDNSTRIYLAAGETFGGRKFLDPLQALFPRLETLSSVAMPEELALATAYGAAVDYLACLLSDIFIPTFNGPSNFADNLIGQRLYYGFRTTLQPDWKALAPLFIAFENESLQTSDFEASVRKVMSRKSSGGPHARVPPESFYTNPWPECFCTKSPREGANHCPSKTSSHLSYDEDEEDNFSGWNV